MGIHIELLRHPEAVYGLLREHGWQLEETETGYAAEHPATPNEPTARRNLHALGLLTSSAVRIELRPLACRSGNRRIVS